MYCHTDYRMYDSPRSHATTYMVLRKNLHEHGKGVNIKKQININN